MPQSPLDQECVSENILFQANVNPLDQSSETKLSNDFWKIKDNNRSANLLEEF